MQHTDARTSELLAALAASAPERLSLGLIGGALGERQLGIVILCMALPNCIPGPALPGFSTVLALPIIWIGGQLALGLGGAGLPRFLRHRTVSRRRFIAFVLRATPWLVRMERWIGPRPSFLTTVPGQRCLGVIFALYGLVLAVPMPFGNIPIGCGIAVLALGLIEEDSRALGIGMAIGVLGCLWQMFLVMVGIRAMALF
jgi:hypothetical protein